MSMYYNVTELETIAKAAQEISAFTQVMNMCAWKYSVYERNRLDCNKYIDEHPTNRPTKDRERLQVECSRAFGEFWSLLDALKTLAEPYGTIHTATIHDEIIEMVNGHDPIKVRRLLLASAC